jgi:hypothetical protein
MTTWGRRTGGGEWQTPGFSIEKTTGMKTGASSSAATDNAAPAKLRPSIDRKKGRFLGLFCR